MRGYRIVVAPELIAEGKHLYEETDTPLHIIAKHMGVSRSTLNYRIADWSSTRRRLSAAGPGEFSAPAVAAAPSEPVPLEPALPFPERLRRVIDAQMQVAERTLKVLGPATNAEAERTTRILAVISRTVQEIQATAEGQTLDEADDDAVPEARRGHAGGGDDGPADRLEPGAT